VLPELVNKVVPDEFGFEEDPVRIEEEGRIGCDVIGTG
jgi:hypothetical protein